MNKIVVNFALIVAMIMLSLWADAQIRSLVRDRAVDAAFSGLKRGEEPEEVETEVTTVDESDENQQPSRAKSKPNFLEQKMMAAMGINNVKYETSYRFPASLSMDITTVDSLGKSEKVLYTTFFDEAMATFAITFEGNNQQTGEKEKSTIIFDAINNAMLILSEKEGERNGIAMYIPPDSTDTEKADLNEVSTVEPDVDFYHPWYSPTGKTKNIAGQTCHEYIYKNEGGSVTLWLNKDKSLNLTNAYSYMNGFQALATAGWGFGQGMVMEMVFRESDSQVSTHMVVNDINLSNVKNLDVSGYNIIGFGGEK